MNHHEAQFNIPEQPSHIASPETPPNVSRLSHPDCSPEVNNHIQLLSHKVGNLKEQIGNTNDLDEKLRLFKKMEQYLIAILKSKEENRAVEAEKKEIPQEISITFTNPETSKKKEITLNLPEVIQKWQDFYATHNLPAINEEEVRSIWEKNQKEIQESIETYGYDNLLIIPENLPDTETLHETMTEGFIDTYKNKNFRAGGSFAGATHAENPKTKIILTHSDQNIYQNPDANPFLKATFEKTILQLSNLTKKQLQEKIRNNEDIPINFKANINGQSVLVQAEGLSLNTYLIWQRQYLEENKKHLDEKGWTWLTKSAVGLRVVAVFWYPDGTQLRVIVARLYDSNDILGCRLSRSFEN